MEERPWHRFYARDVPREIPSAAVTLNTFLAASAARFPSRAAVVLAGPTFHSALSYRALDRLSNRFAHALTALGVRPGDRVAVALPNMPQYPIAAYGVFKAGATLVQVSPLYRGNDLVHVLNDSQARVFVTLTRLYPHLAAVRRDTAVERVVLTKISDYFPPLWRTLYRLRERREGDAMRVGPGVIAWQRLIGAHRAVPVDVPVGPDDLAVLQYTGGTTGRPRGAMLSHRNLVANAAQALAWFSGLREGGECFLVVVPLFHVYGLLVLNAGIRLAATHLMVLMRMFDARQVAEQVPRWRPTVFPGVPAMYLAMNQLKNVGEYNLQSIRFCLSGAASLSLDVANEFERLTGGRLVEGYGLTEASPLVAANPIWEGGVRKPGSIGIPLPSTNARIVDLDTGTRDIPVGEPGELLVRGPQVMTGYWNAPEDTRTAIRGGWLFTGDVARMDEDGFFFVVDRKKDMIDVGGLKVYPQEIEDVLLQHPLVRDAAVVGVRHSVRGETIVAYVTLIAGADDAAAARGAIREHLRGRLPGYKVPRRVEIVDAIPKGLIGKPLRRILREEAQRTEPPVPDATPAPGDGPATT